MRHKQRAQFERFLLAEREQLATMLSDAAPTSVDAVPEPARLGDEATGSASGASVEDDRAIAEHAARELASIDDALRLLHDAPEDYGKCAACAQPIPLERLRLVPGTRYCQTHARDI